MNIRTKFYSIIASVIITTMLYSCGSSASSFYILTPTNNYQQLESNFENNISIGIGNLELPDYLQKPQIVTFKNNNELHFDEFNRWAQPLDENFTDIVLENLSNMIPTNNIYLFMWPEEKLDIYQVTIKINQFELRSDSTVVLDARWSVSISNEIIFLMTEKSSYHEKITNLNYDKIVATMSKLTGYLCRDIASEVKRKATNN